MNYYLILTKDVISAKISANAKILYAVISGLTTDKGYCYASNDYLAEKMELQERQIRNLLKQLKDSNLISIKIIEKNKRFIFLNTNAKQNINIDDTTKTINTNKALEELLQLNKYN